MRRSDNHPKTGNQIIVESNERVEYMAEYVHNSHEQKIKNLENNLKELKKRLEDIEKDSGIRIKWGVRYSQRIAILANILLGLWHFWNELMILLQQRRKSILQSLLSHNKTKQMVNDVVKEAYQFSVWRSSFYFIAALLIFSKYSWKRTIGLFMSCFGISYLYPKSFVGNYFTFFANVLYLTASWTTRFADQDEPDMDFWISLRKYLMISFGLRRSDK